MAQIIVYIIGKDIPFNFWGKRLAMLNFNRVCFSDLYSTS